MATLQSTIGYVLDQLADLPGVRARKMFGEYALYFQDKVVALVCDDQVFLKITPSGRNLLGEGAPEGFPYPGAKPAFLLGSDSIDDSEALCRLVRSTAVDLPVTAPRKRKPKTRLPLID